MHRVWCGGNLKSEKKESKRNNVPSLKLIKAFEPPSHVHPSKALRFRIVSYSM